MSTVAPCGQESLAVRVYNKIEDYLLGYSLLLLAVLAVVQILTRYLFGFAIYWLDEISRYVLILATFLGASLGVKYGTHFSMKAVVSILPLRLKAAVGALVNLSCCFLFALIVYYGFKHVLNTQRFGATSAALNIPMSWAYFSIPFFSLTVSVRYFLAFINNLKSLNENPGSGMKTGAERDPQDNQTERKGA